MEWTGGIGLTSRRSPCPMRVSPPGAPASKGGRTLTFHVPCVV